MELRPPFQSDQILLFKLGKIKTIILIQIILSVSQALGKTVVLVIQILKRYLKKVLKSFSMGLFLIYPKKCVDNSIIYLSL